MLTLHGPETYPGSTLFCDAPALHLPSELDLPCTYAELPCAELDLPCTYHPTTSDEDGPPSGDDGQADDAA